MVGIIKKVFFKRHSIGRHLILSFIIINVLFLSLGCLVFVSTLYMKENMGLIDHVIVENHQLSQLDRSLQKALAALRGWIFVGDVKFKIERRNAWKEGVYPALKKLDQGQSGLFDSGQSQLHEVRLQLNQLAYWQWIIESIANTPGDHQASFFLHHYVDQHVLRIMKNFNALIQLAKQSPEINQAVSIQLLGLQSAINLSYQSLLRYLYNPASRNKQTYLFNIDVIKKELIDVTKSKQGDTVYNEVLQALLGEIHSYLSLSQRVLHLSESKKTDLANYLISTKAIPLARSSEKLIDSMSIMEFNVLQSESSRTVALTEFSLIAALVLMCVLILFSVYLAYRNIMRIFPPIHRLMLAAKSLAKGQYGQDVIVENDDEIGELTNSFNYMRQELKITNESLDKKNKELEQFAYITSHDLKAPLRAIDNLSSWIEEDCADVLPDEAKGNLTLLRGRVARMSQLITGVLDYSRAARLDIDLKEVDVNQVVKEAIENCQPPESIQITSDDDFPILMTAPIPLGQVFSNLISNAIKYHDKPEGHIHISVKALDAFYEFSVKDDGPGIDPQQHEKIFAMFQTLVPKDKVESTGIGLTITKKIVEYFGGKIWVESGLGEGACFKFTWPNKQNEGH